MFYNAYANSSWYWASKVLPWHLLPFIIIFTLIIEIGFIHCLCKTDWIRTIIVISIANLVSFGVPFLSATFSVVHPFPQSLEDYHSIVNSIYLILTLVIEVPIVTAFLKTENKTRLLTVAIIANIITTLMVLLVEELFCWGYYA